MKKVFIHQPIFRIVAPFFVGIIAYLLVLLFFDSVIQIIDVFFSQEAILCIVLAYFQFEAMRVAIKQTKKRWADLDSAWYLAGQLSINLLVSTIIISTGIICHFRFVVGYDFSTYHTELLVINSAFTLISFAYTALYLSVFYLNRQNKRRLRQEKAIQQNIELQLEAFKNQVNPIFLYKSLESLISLIHHSPEVAEDFIDQLAAIYRYSLDNQKEDLVPIEQEIKSVKKLIELENYRFHQNISIEIDIEEDEKSNLVVPNTIHWIVEYLIENTIISDTQPMKIQCFYESTICFLIPLQIKLEL